jgi:hypothetical protein
LDARLLRSLRFGPVRVFAGLGPAPQLMAWKLSDRCTELFQGTAARAGVDCAPVERKRARLCVAAAALERAVSGTCRGRGSSDRDWPGLRVTTHASEVVSMFGHSTQNKSRTRRLCRVLVLHQSGLGQFGGTRTTSHTASYFDRPTP